jgi:hypothetical protein
MLRYSRGAANAAGMRYALVRVFRGHYTRTMAGEFVSAGFVPQQSTDSRESDTAKSQSIYG